MATISRRTRAFFETTRRLLAQLINEGLLHGTVDSSGPFQPVLRLSGPRPCSHGFERYIQVSLVENGCSWTRGFQIQSLLSPSDLQQPVLLVDQDCQVEEICPGEVFYFIRPWLPDGSSEETLLEIAEELRNSARNQDGLTRAERWLEIEENQKVLDIGSPAIDWENRLIYGHRTHPFHRLCFAQPPLKPVEPDDIPDMIHPVVAFVSIPRTDVRFTGPFEQKLRPLLEKLNVPIPSMADRTVVPCLAQQLPAIILRFPNAEVVHQAYRRATSQASMRTISLDPGLDFRYHLKFPLACRITSVVRTTTPWTGAGPALSQLLKKLLPSDLWLYGEVATVHGSQEDFNDAKHLSCILREDPEQRAHAQGEALIVAASLHQKPQGKGETYAEILFNLKSTHHKLRWLESYVRCLFRLVLTPLFHHGIGLEVHGQNTVIRICRESRQIKGFAVRDFGGIRLHTPTFKKKGISLATMLPGASILTDEWKNVWTKVHHAMIQNHVGDFVVSLGLENYGGWATIRSILSLTIEKEFGGAAKGMHDYLVSQTMPFKCFLRMRIEGKDYVERAIPNVLLSDANHSGLQ